MPDLSIELSNPNKPWYYGEIVPGRVILYTDKPLKVKEICIWLEGAAKVSEREADISAEEAYISDPVRLWGNGISFSTLQAGSYELPFTLPLKEGFPSTFTSKFGQISYILRAEVRRNFLKVNNRAELPLNVNGKLDLNQVPSLGQMQICKDSKGGAIWWWKGRMGFVFKIDKSGFCPGETLRFSGEVDNKTKKCVGMTVRLIQVVGYFAQGKKKVKRTIVGKLRGPDVDPGKGEVWNDKFIVGNLPPTRLGGGCGLIDVQYEVFFEVRGNNREGLRGRLPITIGTIGLSQK